MTKDELYALYTELLGVLSDHIVNEYGMTEMGSQFYDGLLREHATRRTAPPAGASQSRDDRPGRPYGPGEVPISPPRGLGPPPRRKAAPPWVRTVVVDPETLTPMPPGHTGVLRHYDLANLDSVIALQTADLGFADEHGFEIIGRAAGSEARGCSLAVEELLRAQA